MFDYDEMAEIFHNLNAPIRGLQRYDLDTIESIVRPNLPAVDGVNAILRPQMIDTISAFNDSMAGSLEVTRNSLLGLNRLADQIRGGMLINQVDPLARAIDGFLNPEWLQQLADTLSWQKNMFSQLNESFAQQGLRSEYIHSPAFIRISEVTIEEYQTGEIMSDYLLMFLAIFDTVAYLETRFRKSIREAMSRTYTQDHKHQLPNSVLRSGNSYRAKHDRGRGLDIYHFLTLENLKSIVQSKWNEVFSRYLPSENQSQIADSISEFSSHRDDVAHLREFDIVQYASFTLTAFVLEKHISTLEESLTPSDDESLT